MTFVITSSCCNDVSCIPVCPVDCIRPRPEDPDFLTAEQLYIDADTCIDCGACMDVCPVGAIHPDGNVSASMQDSLLLSREYFDLNPLTDDSPAFSSRPALIAQPGEECRVAVVGSGPAGCYAALALLTFGASVTIFDRLSTPYGLARWGVAPDHPETRQITSLFERVIANRDVTSYFDVEVGTDVTLDELLIHHHAVIWAAGAGSSRSLGLEGEELPGSVSASELVGWYNGHRDFSTQAFELTGERAVVIGNGNVALDVARILARPADDLAATDISEDALAALRASSLREVVVTGRRGPEHASYSTGELAALGQVDGVALRTRASEVSHLAPAPDRRSQIIVSAADASAVDDERSIELRFDLRPESINGVDRVESVTFTRADGSRETIETRLVIRAIGFSGRPVSGLPFDASRTLPHVGGRVLDTAAGDPLCGIYCAGWAKRGAQGKIGTNRHDSAETVTSLIEDLRASRLGDPVGSPDQLRELLRSRTRDLVAGVGG